MTIVCFYGCTSHFPPDITLMELSRNINLGKNNMVSFRKDTRTEVSVRQETLPLPLKNYPSLQQIFNQP